MDSRQYLHGILEQTDLESEIYQLNKARLINGFSMEINLRDWWFESKTLFLSDLLAMFFTKAPNGHVSVIRRTSKIVIFDDETFDVSIFYKGEELFSGKGLSEFPKVRWNEITNFIQRCQVLNHQLITINFKLNSLGEKRKSQENVEDMFSTDNYVWQIKRRLSKLVEICISTKTRPNYQLSNLERRLSLWGLSLEEYKNVKDFFSWDLNVDLLVLREIYDDFLDISINEILMHRAEKMANLYKSRLLRWNNLQQPMSKIPQSKNDIPWNVVVKVLKG